MKLLKLKYDKPLPSFAIKFNLRRYNLAYICECHGLKEVADYWYSVVGMNDYQKKRFVKRVVSAMFNTIRNKKIAMLGFAFKKDTGDTRETPAIDVGRGLHSSTSQLNLSRVCHKNTP
jgi:UDPglucose 6-dehydrogenase